MRDAAGQLLDCPTRPPCPVCGMHMFATNYLCDNDGFEQCRFECMRCGHSELSRPAKHGG
jgi:hypothetical protein